MRKIYLILFALAGTFSVQAQSNLEYHLGLGLGSFQAATVQAGTHSMISVAPATSENSKRTYSTAGPIRFGIKKHEGKHFLLGAEFNYTNIETNDASTTGGASVFTNFTHYTLMASTQYKYIDKPKLTLYTGIDFGISYATAKNQSDGRKENDLNGAFQLNFLGIRYGSKLGLFGEVGFGYNGFFSGGLFYRVN